MENLLDKIAQYISEYTFINSDGEEYQDDGYQKAHNFIQDMIFPEVDKYVNEYYNVKEEATENEE